VGGVLYDNGGFAAPFVASAIMGGLAFVAALVMVPETRTPEIRWRETLRKRRSAAITPSNSDSFWDSLPRPLFVFITLLALDFFGVFVFGLVEPQMVFYFYDELGWTTIQFGVVVGAYGLSMVFGQVVLGRASDRFGRKPVILLGIMLSTLLYAGLVLVTAYPMMLLVAAVAGMGSAMIAPALSAYYLDISAEQHRSRILGIKESSTALGGVAGPLLLVAVTAALNAKGVFILAGAVMLGSGVLALLALPKPGQVQVEVKELDWGTSEKRALAAQSTLRGVVMRASAARIARTTG
jgi:DHA1 family tetracycline resistance protein-like MFS transporter